jgi:FMN phosphatase YigB (HAD superfamily)
MARHVRHFGRGRHQRFLFSWIAQAIFGWEKPQPEIFTWALEQTGLEPQQCVHIGDQPFFDAEPAIACGLHGVLLDRFGRYPKDNGYPSIATLDEFDATIRRIASAG